jgi:hypothetical protein
VGFLAALIAVYGIIPATSASVSVTPTEPIEADLTPEGGRPIVVPFRVSNDGNTRVDAVRAECTLHDVRLSNNARIEDIHLQFSSSATINFLDPGRQVDMSCDENLASPTFAVENPGAHLEYADISFFISYKPRWRLGRESEEFHIVGFREPDGRLRWLRQAPTNPESEPIFTDD